MTVAYWLRGDTRSVLAEMADAGIVVDLIAGSGTTLAVATGHGRDAIGIDLDERNIELARDRVGPLLFTVTTVGELVQLAAPAMGGAA